MAGKCRSLAGKTPVSSPKTNHREGRIAMLLWIILSIFDAVRGSTSARVPILKSCGRGASFRGIISREIFAGIVGKIKLSEREKED
jgi:hypothetical protein